MLPARQLICRTHSGYGLAVSRPAFPKDWLLDPNSFGRSTPVRWVRPASRHEESRLKAAQLQHEITAAVAKRMWVRGVDRRQLAAECGLRYAQLGRLMRGEVWMSVTHLGELFPVLGELVQPADVH